MQYILDVFEGEEFWIEIDEEGYALRQIIIEGKNVQISCFTDCLAEGIINLNELDGDIKLIKSQEFENKWNELLESYKSDWELKKKIFKINMHVLGRIKYFYPQGTIVQLEGVQGICVDGLPANIMVDTLVEWIIQGYDDKNMWCILKPAN